MFVCFSSSSGNFDGQIPGPGTRNFLLSPEPSAGLLDEISSRQKRSQKILSSASQQRGGHPRYWPWMTPDRDAASPKLPGLALASCTIYRRPCPQPAGRIVLFRERPLKKTCCYPRARQFSPSGQVRRTAVTVIFARVMPPLSSRNSKYCRHPPSKSLAGFCSRVGSARAVGAVGQLLSPDSRYHGAKG